MYVNDLTLDYGERGRQGVERLMTEAFEKGLIPKRVRSNSPPDRRSGGSGQRQVPEQESITFDGPSTSTANGLENIGPAVAQV